MTSGNAVVPEEGRDQRPRLFPQQVALSILGVATALRLVDAVG